MAADRIQRDQARLRLVRLSTDPELAADEVAPFVPEPPPSGLAFAPGPAFVPVRPSTRSDRGSRTGGRSGASEPPSEGAASAEAALLRGRAMASAAAAYSSAHGPPLEHVAGGHEPARWATRGRVAAAMVVVLAALCAAVVGHAVRQTPREVVDLADAQPAVQGSADASPSGADTARSATVTAPTAASAEVVVHVVGEVLNPGVVTLPAGSRVADALEKAGGSTALADLGALNLARVLQDGEQVVVAQPGQAVPEAAGARPGGPAPGGLDLNSADAAALDELPGIGPVLAQRIVEWRTLHGAFTTVDELREVAGIGDKVLANLEGLVRV